MCDAATWTAIIAPLSVLGGTVAGFWFSGRQDEKRDERAAVWEATARPAAIASNTSTTSSRLLEHMFE